MKIETYQYENEAPSEWKLKRFFLKDINLLAGVSGVGKTRILRTIYLLSQTIQHKKPLMRGKWDINFIIGEKKYRYQLNIDTNKDKTSQHKNIIFQELLTTNGTKVIDRENDIFIFNGTKLPNLGNIEVGLYLLKNEESIKDVFEEFTKFYNRSPNLLPREEMATDLGAMPKEIIFKESKSMDLKNIIEKYKQINLQLYLIKEYHREVYEEIKENFKLIYPFVEEIDIKPINEVPDVEVPPIMAGAFVPIITIHERNVKDDISLMNLSSGMVKALIYLIDIFSVPKESIYLIDEVENSFGIKSLPTMIDILISKSNEIQFVLTSHHPYIINNISIKHWQILNRNGSVVEVIDGDEFADKYSNSHQDAFTQLMNSKYFEDGI